MGRNWPVWRETLSSLNNCFAFQTPQVSAMEMPSRAGSALLRLESWHAWTPWHTNTSACTGTQPGEARCTGGEERAHFGAAVSSVGSRAGRAAAAGGFHPVGGAVQKSILLVIRLVCDGGWEAAAAPAPVLSAPEHGHRGDTGRAVSRDAPDGGYSPRASVTTRRFTAAETAQRDARSLADCGHNGAFADTN